MNHAFSSPRNELERSAVARPVRQINNVICSPGSRPIRSGPKDFVRMVCMYGRTSVAVPHFPQIENQGKGRGSLFPPLSLSLCPSPSFASFPFATFIFWQSDLSTAEMVFKQGGKVTRDRRITFSIRAKRYARLYESIDRRCPTMDGLN